EPPFRRSATALGFRPATGPATFPAKPVSAAPTWAQRASSRPQSSPGASEEVAVGHEVEHPAGYGKVLAELSQHAGHRHRPVGCLLRHPIGPAAEPFEQPDPIVMLRAFPIRGGERAFQPVALPLGDELLGGVIRK